MARYDKYDPISGGFRGTLEADLTADGNGNFGPKAVSINTAGRVVVGTAGASGCVGLVVKNAPRRGVTGRSTSLIGLPNANAWLGLKAGDVVDIMTAGEIVDIAALGFTPGQAIYAEPDGDLTATASGNIKVGWVVGSGAKQRLVVRFAA